MLVCNASNNQVEAMALLQGLRQLRRKEISQAREIEDSQILICFMVRSSISKDIPLKQIILRIQNISIKFHKLRYFHVLHKDNTEGEQTTNRVVVLEPSILLIND